MDKTIETHLIVVMNKDKKSCRCIYLNDHRIIGEKPYISEI
jgi:hypothetical protein